MQPPSSSSSGAGSTMLKVVKVIALVIAGLVATTVLGLVTCYFACSTAMDASTRAMTRGVRFHAHAGSCPMQLRHTDEDGSMRSRSARGPDNGGTNDPWQSAPLDIASGTELEITVETTNCMAPARCWITHHDGTAETQLAAKVVGDDAATCRAVVP